MVHNGHDTVRGRERRPGNAPGRIEALIWMVVSVIAIAVFTAGLTSSLTTRRLQGPVTRVPVDAVAHSRGWRPNDRRKNPAAASGGRRGDADHRNRGRGDVRYHALRVLARQFTLAGFSRYRGRYCEEWSLVLPIERSEMDAVQVRLRGRSA